MDVRIVICGMGRVGRAFFGLLLQKDKDLKERYGLALKVVAAVDIGGAAVGPEGLPLQGFLVHLERGGRVEDRIGYGQKGFTSGEAIGNGQKAQKRVEHETRSKEHGFRRPYEKKEEHPGFLCYEGKRRASHLHYQL